MHLTVLTGKRNIPLRNQFTDCVWEHSKILLSDFVISPSEPTEQTAVLRKRKDENAISHKV